MPGSTLALNGQSFDDLHFTTEPGFGLGTYILVQAQGISGSLGTSTSGTIDGLPATLAVQGGGATRTWC